MTAEDEKQVDALFAAGDPAARMPAMLPQRVAARLASEHERQQRGGFFGFARWAVVGVTLVSSAGLGAAAVWVTNEARKPAPVPVEAKPVVAKAAVAVAKPMRVADPLAAEAALLQESLEALQRGDAVLALKKLDAREQQFPGGLLASEAAVARLKALLLARRDDEALAGFAKLHESDLTEPLKLTWADLLVKHGRCTEAVGVLSTVEASPVATSLRARCGR